MVLRILVSEAVSFGIPYIDRRRPSLGVQPQKLIEIVLLSYFTHDIFSVFLTGKGHPTRWNVSGLQQKYNAYQNIRNSDTQFDVEPLLEPISVSKAAFLIERDVLLSNVDNVHENDHVERNLRDV